MDVHQNNYFFVLHCMGSLPNGSGGGHSLPPQSTEYASLALTFIHASLMKPSKETLFCAVGKHFPTASPLPKNSAALNY